MSTVQTLLAKCREMGAELSATTDGHLTVKAPAPLPEEVMEALKQHKAEVMVVLSQESLPFPCPSCGGQVQLEPPVPEELPAWIWTCACGAWGATRPGAVDAVVWVRSKLMQ